MPTDAGAPGRAGDAAAVELNGRGEPAVLARILVDGGLDRLSRAAAAPVRQVEALLERAEGSRAALDKILRTEQQRAKAKKAPTDTESWLAWPSLHKPLCLAQAAALARIICTVERHEDAGLRWTRVGEAPWVVTDAAFVAPLRELGHAADELAGREIVASPAEALQVLQARVEGTLLETLGSSGGAARPAGTRLRDTAHRFSLADAAPVEDFAALLPARDRSAHG